MTKRSGIVSPPIERGEIKDWDQLESLWQVLILFYFQDSQAHMGILKFGMYHDIRRHILLKDFNIKRTRNECPVILTVPSRWTKEEHERIAQILMFPVFILQIKH